jgi:lycopene beta-cyclase
MRMRDVVVVGAGAAGLTLAVEAAEASSDLRVRLVEAPTSRSPERTWCFWEVGAGPYDDLLTASWDTVRVHAQNGRGQRLDLRPYRYKMLSSSVFIDAMNKRAADAGVERVVLDVSDVWDVPTGGVRISGRDADGRLVIIDDADAVFDTRPTQPLTDGSVHLLQHFRGWFVRASSDLFDAETTELMDFRTKQPDHGVSFGYVLPTSAREALIEYTEFSASVLDDHGYDAALKLYITRNLGLDVDALEIVSVEQGAIPMTDATFPRRLGEGHFRLGAAGGATRPSTGYTFVAAQRQAHAVAAALAAGTDPTPPAAYTRRHLAMDRLMLRALDSGRIEGADFLARLFADHPTERVLRFLDGATTPSEDVAIMRSAPMGPMMRTFFAR